MPRNALREILPACNGQGKPVRPEIDLIEPFAFEVSDAGQPV